MTYAFYFIFKETNGKQTINSTCKQRACLSSLSSGAMLICLYPKGLYGFKSYQLDVLKYCCIFHVEIQNKWQTTKTLKRLITE